MFPAEAALLSLGAGTGAAALGGVAVLWLAAAAVVAGIALIAVLEAQMDKREAKVLARACRLASARAE